MSDVAAGTRVTMVNGEIQAGVPTAGKRFRLSPSAAYMMLRDRTGSESLGALREPGPADPRTRAAVDHWVARGWDISLDYYMASRDIDYADKADPDNSVRRALIERVMAEEPVPARRPVTGPRVPLPQPAPPPVRPLGEVLMGRRSVRRYRTGATTAAQVSQLLAQGLDAVRRLRETTDFGEPLDLLLKSFGAGFEYYVACYDVAGIDRGVYHYDLVKHTLTRVSDIPELEQEQWFWGMPGPRTAAGTVVFVSDFAQVLYRYSHERALRDLYIEAGRLAQRLIVAAGYAGLGTVVTPAVRDTLVNERFALDPAREAVIYTVTFGVDGRESAGRARL